MTSHNDPDEQAAMQELLDRWDRESWAMLILTSEAMRDWELDDCPDVPLIGYVDFDAMPGLLEELK